MKDAKNDVPAKCMKAKELKPLPLSIILIGIELVFSAGLSRSASGRTEMTQVPAPGSEDFQESSRASASGAIRMALSALAKVRGVELEIHSVEGSASLTDEQNRKNTSVHSKILASGMPLKYVARRIGEDGRVHQLAVFDGSGYRISINGEVRTIRKLPGGTPAIDLLLDTERAAGLLLDHNLYERMLSTGSLLLAGQNAIDGDVCDVILHVRENSVLHSIESEYLWLSRATHLPRSFQVFVIVKGQSLPTRRWFIDKVTLHSDVPAGIFTYRPTARDTAPVVREK